MPTESTTAILNWSVLQGTLLDGGYEVEECQSKTENSARFALRILGDRFTKASVRFFAPGGVSSEQLAIWTDACAFPQAGLSRPMGVGQLRLEGQSLRYVMFVEADETLNDVLRERPLAPEEVREIVRTAVDALGGLHSRGYVHAVLSPKTILGIRDSILLSTVGLRRIGQPLEDAPEAQYLAPESRSENSTPEADIWCLGATVYEALTQTPFEVGKIDETLTLPSPFHAIASRCLEDDPHMRCSLSAIRAMLRGEQLDLVSRKKPATPKLEKPNAETVTAVAPEANAAVAAPAPPLAFAAAAGASAVASKSPANPPADRTAPEITGTAESALNGHPPSPAVAETAKLSSEPTAGTQVEATGHVNGPGRTPPKGVPTANASIAAAASSGALDEMYGRPDRPAIRPARARITPPERPRVRPVLPPRPDPASWTNSGAFPSPSEYKAEIAKQSARTKTISYIALALVLVAGVFWLTFSGSPTKQPTVGASAPAAAQSAKQTWPARELGPSNSGQSSSGAGSPAASSPAGSAGHSAAAADSPTPSIAGAVPGSVANWRVVAYTANHLADAQRRAQQIMAKHPGFSPEVFSPKGSGAPYLVILGGQLSHDQAIKVRQRARAAGMPRDTYIQNFTR